MQIYCAKQLTLGETETALWPDACLAKGWFASANLDVDGLFVEFFFKRVPENDEESARQL